MAEPFGFVEEDTYELVVTLVDRDTRAMVDWLERHVKTHRDMHALFEFLGRIIYKTWPMALTKDVKVGDADYWAMRTKSTASRVTVRAAQMITTSLNGDWDTLTPLIHATLSEPEEFHGEVVAHLMAAVGDGLRAVTESAVSEEDHD